VPPSYGNPPDIHIANEPQCGLTYMHILKDKTLFFSEIIINPITNTNVWDPFTSKIQNFFRNLIM
jgi:hypothetical protein